LYQQRNGVVDYRLDGVCNHYFPVYEGSEPSFKNGEIVLTCKVSKTVKGQMRYTFQIDGKRIAEKRIVSECLDSCLSGLVPQLHFLLHSPTH
jgi:hypothetical protein